MRPRVTLFALLSVVTLVSIVSAVYVNTKARRWHIQESYLKDRIVVSFVEPNFAIAFLGEFPNNSGGGGGTFFVAGPLARSHSKGNRGGVAWESCYAKGVLQLRLDEHLIVVEDSITMTVNGTMFHVKDLYGTTTMVDYHTGDVIGQKETP